MKPPLCSALRLRSCLTRITDYEIARLGMFGDLRMSDLRSTRTVDIYSELTEMHP